MSEVPLQLAGLVVHLLDEVPVGAVAWRVPVPLLLGNWGLGIRDEGLGKGIRDE
jgi:hypothetical protein